MKKLSIILLVLALAGGMAFGADLAIAGDVTFSTSFDLGAMAGGFDANANTLAYTASSTLVLLTGGSADKTGTGDVYAVLEVSLADLVMTTDNATVPVLPIALNAISIDTFKIVAGDITVDLLGNSPAGDYVAYFDYDLDAVADMNTAAIGLLGNNGGVDVTAGDITVGVDFWYAGDNLAAIPAPVTTYLVWGAYSSVLADGLTVSVAAGMDNAAGADVAGQVAYAAEGYGVTVGFDSADNFGLYEVEADIDAVIDIVTVDANVYYDNTDKLVRVADQNTIALEDLTLGLDFYWDDTASGKKVAADVDLSSLVESMTVTLAGGFMLDGTNNIDALLNLGYTVSAETSVTAYVGYDMAAASTTNLSAGASLTQSMDAGILLVSFDLNNDATATMDLAASFTSTTLVDGATCSLGWAADDIVNSLGVVTASVVVTL